MQAPVRVGQRVAGKYEVERVLGRGGVGVVVKARHLRLVEPCAIKLMRPEALEVPLARERFLREARACARLASDHVVKVFDVGELDDGTPYMVLEYLEGVDLGTHLGGGRLPVGEASRYVLQVCAALAEAHALGIVHRDIKPENVFLARRRDGTVRVKLLDFGISKVIGEAAGADQVTTIEGTVMGTPSFMAPEQIRGDAIDARVDVWAVGVLLHHLLTGAFPFRGRTPHRTLASVLQDAPAPPSRYVPSLPPELDRIVLRCLEKNAADRPGSVGEIAAAIAPFAEGGSRRRPRRRRWNVPAVLSGLLIAASAGIAFAPRGPQAPAAPAVAPTTEAPPARLGALPPRSGAIACRPLASAAASPGSVVSAAPLASPVPPAPPPPPTSPSRAAGFDLRERL
jgi:serine/threonine-protein kinase